MKKPKQGRFLPIDMAPSDLVTVVPGALGHHAVVQGRQGLWATSKESPEDALCKCIARHLLPQLLKLTVEAGTTLVVKIKAPGIGVFDVSTGEEAKL